MSVVHLDVFGFFVIDREIDLLDLIDVMVQHFLNVLI